MRLLSLHLLSSLTTTMSPPSSSLSLSSATPKTPSNSSSSNPNPNPNNNHHNFSSSSSSSIALCSRHSPFLTLDLLIFVLVLFSGTFLLTSYFSYIFHSLSLLRPISLSFSSPSALYFLAFSLFFLASALSFEICCGFRSRKCQNPKCKGLKKAMEFDLQLQTEECLRSSSSREMDELPWKGGREGNPDYECLRTELRRMAPPNGRAVLLFRVKCGCPVAKLEGWGAKRWRKHKKGLALNGGGDYR